MKKVLVLMGSVSDKEVMSGTKEVLDSLNIESEVRITSAHRTPEKSADLAKNAASNGFGVIIAGAGYAAHLAGAIAANTTLPVIGVPLAGSPLKGFDSLLSTVMMPSGMPVASMAVGSTGAKNAAWFAAQILAINDESLSNLLKQKREEMKQKVEAEDKV